MALIVLPVVFLLLWFQVWCHRSLLGSASITRRGAFLLAFLLFETLVLAISELSSIGHHFTRGAVLASWLIVAGILLALSWRLLTLMYRDLLAAARSGRLTGEMMAAAKTETAAWLVIPLVYVAIFVYLGIAYVPSNGDSLDYHLARVMHWIQDRSVAPFPAHFTAQVDYSPLSEYNLAHFHLLVGSDRLDGFVQLFAAVVCLVAVSEITRLLGGRALVQVGAVVICTTVPSLVLSATSTENNLFAASFCICLVYVLLAMSPLRDWWSFAVFGALAASLAYLSKGTAVVLIGPVAIALVIFRVATESNYSSRVRLRAWLQIAGVALLAGLVVAGPFLYQDQSLFGSPDGPDAQAVLSTDLTWRAAGGDIVRTIAANFMMGNGTNGPETAVSKFLLGKFHRVYDAFGVPQDDPDYFVGQDTQDYFDAFGVRNFTVWDRSEDEGADPLDVILLCFASVSTVILLIRGDRRMRVVVLIALGLTVGFLILAGISRWQIYEVRFFIPLFVAWSPIIAIALFRCSPWLLRAMMVLLVVASLPQLLDNSERPVMQNSYGHNPLAPYFLNPRLAARSVVSNDRSYITTTAADFEKFSKIVAESTCKRLGIGNFLVFEYPVWVGLHEDGWRGEIQDVNVDNVTRRYEDTGFHPCAVITQPMWPYAGTDPTMVQIGFGPKLALSISPQDLQRVNVPIQGFSSRAPGVRVFPGSGWRFGTSVTLTGVGTLLVSSATTRTVDLQVDGPGGARAGIGITATTPGTHVGTVTTTNGSGLAQVKLAAGVTSIQLADVPAPGHSTGVDGVTLEDTAQTAGS